MQYAPETENDSPPELRLAALRATAEVELLGAVLARPADLVAVAEREGIAQWDFGQDDLRLIWLAAAFCAESKIDKPYKAARLALQHGGFWDGTQIAGNYRTSMLWSDASLGALFGSHFPNPSQVQVNARRLLRLIRAEKLYRKILDRAEMVIQSAITPISPRRAG